MVFLLKAAPALIRRAVIDIRGNIIPAFRTKAHRAVYLCSAKRTKHFLSSFVCCHIVPLSIPCHQANFHAVRTRLLTKSEDHKYFPAEKLIFHKILLAFFFCTCYHRQRLIGQGVKTPPSHGGNRGSIPLSTAEPDPEMDRALFSCIIRSPFHICTLENNFPSSISNPQNHGMIEIEYRN